MHAEGNFGQAQLVVLAAIEELAVPVLTRHKVEGGTAQVLNTGVENLVTHASAINIEIARKIPVYPCWDGARRYGTRPLLFSIKWRVDAIDVLVEQVFVHFRTSSVQNLLALCIRSVRGRYLHFHLKNIA